MEYFWYYYSTFIQKCEKKRDVWDYLFEIQFECIFVNVCGGGGFKILWYLPPFHISQHVRKEQLTTMFKVSDTRDIF